MQISQVLNTAADLIESRGWADYEADTDEAWGLDSETAPLCLEGGILAVAGVGLHNIEACPAYRAVHDYLALPPHERVYRWNDNRKRTASEVIEVLRAAAVIEEARESQPVRVVS